MLSLRAAALSDIGRVRRENEDRFILDEAALVFGIADGVGGLPGGGEAAQHAVDEMLRLVRPVPLTQEVDLFEMVRQTNTAVADLGQKMSPSMGIGTTLTLGCIRNGVLKIGHVGDSRAYIVRDRLISRITEDHSVENEARLRRARGEVVYYHEVNRNALTRCIGQPTPPDVDIICCPLKVGDRYLFCSDGITRMLSEPDLQAIMLKHAEPKGAIDEIVGLAVRRGGPDNATGVVIFIDAV